MKTDREIVELLQRTGHLEFPFGKQQKLLDGATVLDHPEVEKAIASYQDFMVQSLEPLALQHHSRPCQCDGVIGPATRELFEQPRCGCPDYGPKVQPAVGTGSWKRCHGIGDFHSATVYVDDRNMPSWLKPHFDAVWAQNVAAYDRLGLRWTRVNEKKGANITFSFETGRVGWIGLALVGSRQSCGSNIWCRYSTRYHPVNILEQWAGLVAHELGHNASLWHTRGGIMNPSINKGRLPLSWDGDPSESILKRFYGGEPIKPEPPPTPPVPPTPPGAETYGILEWYQDGRLIGRYDVLPRAKAP